MIARLCFVIVNYNTAELTKDCVETLLPQIDAGADRIVVADNASGREDRERLARYLEAPARAGIVRVVYLSENNGFSAGNNAGIADCPAGLYVLTNSDTLFHPGSVEKLLSAAAAYPSAGIISPRLEWPDGKVQVSCFRFHSPLSEAIRSANTGLVTGLLDRYRVPLAPVLAPTHPDWTSFACALVRKSVLDRIGPLDDGYFMYYEDTDFCRRARMAGFDIVNWPEARVIHLQGKSSDVHERTIARKRLPDYFYRSRSRYYKKYYGFTGFLAANLCWLLGRGVSLGRQLVGNRGRPVPSGEFFGIWKSEAIAK